MSLTILVVDDDLGTRLSISDYLELSGYSVITAIDGQEALAMVQEYHPDLMVTDIVMPRINGYQLVRQVRKIPEFCLLPVILLTARTRTQEKILGYESGCDLYLPKPFELEELGAAIRNLLARSQIIKLQPSSPPDQGFASPSDSQEQSTAEVENSSKIQLSLTPREQQVLELLTHGLSNGHMGHQLHLSSRTVEKYVSSLLRKTETSNRAELVAFAIKHRLVE